jgi:hypothetical protein
MLLPSKAYMLWCEDAADYCYYADGTTGDFTTRGSIFSNCNINCHVYKPMTNSSIIFKNFSGVNTATLDSDGIFAAMAAIAAPLI